MIIVTETVTEAYHHAKKAAPTSVLAYSAGPGGNWNCFASVLAISMLAVLATPKTAHDIGDLAKGPR